MQRICRPNHKKEKLVREIWETEFAIKKIENILTRNRIIKPTETEEASETEPADRKSVV